MYNVQSSQIKGGTGAAPDTLFWGSRVGAESTCGGANVTSCTAVGVSKKVGVAKSGCFFKF